MEEQRVYLIAQLDEASGRALAALYGELSAAGLRGVQTPDFPYHITLGSVGLPYEKQMLERARTVCGQMDAFTVPLSHIGLFGLRVLFAAPAANHALIALHEALIPEGLSEDEYDWVPHATLLIDEPENILKAVPIVAASFTPMTAVIDRVGVYEFPPPRFLACFPLRA